MKNKVLTVLRNLFLESLVGKESLICKAAIIFDRFVVVYEVL